MALWLALLGIGAADAARPSDLAPGAPELQEAEQRLASLLEDADAVRAATSRLQAHWVLMVQPPVGLQDPKAKAAPVDPCSPERVALAWRIERFGAAWREAAQAAHAEAARVDTLRAASTVAPLVDARWAERLKQRFAAEASGTRAFVEASVWQSQFVRPALAACGATSPVPDAAAGADDAADAAPADAPAGTDAPVDAPAAPPPNGEALRFTYERGHRAAPVAILAEGDGWICPGGSGPAVRADDAVVLLDAAADGSASACWAASTACGCAASTVYPGGVLGPPGS